jgi:hypothetical protein
MSEYTQHIEFNTGYIYLMDLQFDTPSSIHMFGGMEDSMLDIYGHVWTQNDRSNILHIIGPNLPPIEQFVLSIEGTSQLCRFLKEEGRPPRVILSSIIYHQLLYNDPLKAWYILPEDR